ncbi:MAG: hypothetical protein HZB40_13330 [Rhodocyclales bacterium]|nr:hypothetical protein [Rhodocyclales bacterium]
MNITGTNDAPVGHATVSGSSIQGQTLTASHSLIDPDGLGAVTYIWQSSNDGNSWNTIGSGASLLLDSGLIGKMVKAVASYTDVHGTLEIVASAATSPVSMYHGGSNAADILSGSSAPDVIDGGFGNDTLSGGQSNDVLNGGFGLDLAVFSGTRSGYSIVKSGNSYIVTDINSSNGDDGTDTLIGVERVQFSDAEIGVATVAGMRIGHVEYPANWLDYYTVSDFNSDGKMDIWWKTKGGQTGVWTTEAASSWNPDSMHSPFADWTTADGNGDGRADAAFQHLAGGGSRQWVNAEQGISLAAIGTDHGWGMF